MSKKLEWVGGEVLPLANDCDAVMLSIYGPRGEYQFVGDLTAHEARRLAAELVRAADRLSANGLL